VRFAAALLLIGCVLGGCKEHESLVIFALKTSQTDPDIKTVELTVGPVPGGSDKVTRTFSVSGGLSATNPTSLGVYVPSSIVGPTIALAAVASKAAGCGGYSNHREKAAITAAGDTVVVPITLGADPNACPITGTGGTTGTAGATGTAGRGGTTGSAGSGGTTGAAGTSGTTGAAGTGTAGTTGAGGGQVIPSLTKCTEYDHNDPTQPACDDKMGISNWTVWSIAFSPNGRLFASSADDGRVKIWSFDGKTLTNEGHVLSAPGGAYSIAFSPDGTTLAVGHNAGVDLFAVGTWGINGSLDGITTRVLDLAYAADGSVIYAVDGSKQHLFRHAGAGGPPQVMTLLPASGYAVAVSPASAATVAVAYTNGSAQLFNATSTALTPGMSFGVTTDQSTATTVRFSPNGTLLAAGGADGLLNFWSIPLTSTTPTGSDIVFMNNTSAQDVNMVAFHPTGTYVGVATGGFGVGGGGSIWDVVSRGNRGRYIGTYYMTAAAWSPDGKAFALGEVTCGKVAVCID